MARSLRFYFDENIAPQLVEALRVLCALEYPDDELAHQKSKFPPGIPDVDWLPALKAEGQWTIISGDKHIARSPAEQRKWLQAGLPTFFLASGWMEQKFWAQADHLVRVWPNVRRTALKAAAGAGFSVSFRSARIDVLPPITNPR